MHKFASCDGCQPPRTSAPSAQRSIGQDLRDLVAAAHLNKPDERLQRACKLIIRNDAACISCATHFLRLDVKRR